MRCWLPFGEVASVSCIANLAGTDYALVESSCAPNEKKQNAASECTRAIHAKHEILVPWNPKAYFSHTQAIRLSEQRLYEMP